MANDDSRCYQEASGEDSHAIQHLRQSVADGKPWHVALLEAIGLWTCPEEDVNGHYYCYLIDGEAFDWLLLAERLCQEVAGAIPEEELTTLLFFGRLPEEFSAEKFRQFIGEAKYHAYLNYLYGVTIEKFLLLAVEEEICKESQACVFASDMHDPADGHQRLYGASQVSLLRTFREEKGYSHKETIGIGQLHEFTYWLFKHRLKSCDKARVASDTKKGMECLRRLNSTSGVSDGQEESARVIDHIF